jgi:hypothetical protein
MDMATFHKELELVKKHLDKYTKKNYKYNTKNIEEEIAKIRYDLDQLVQVIGCIADGYTELYILMMKIVERLKNGGT